MSKWCQIRIRKYITCSSNLSLPRRDTGHFYPQLPVRIADGAGGLGQGGVVLHRDEVGEGGEGGDLLVDAEADVVVLLAAKHDGVGEGGVGEAGAGRGRVHVVAEQVLLQQEDLLRRLHLRLLVQEQL